MWDDEINKKLDFEGWTVIRFWGEDIKKHTDECVKVVEEAIWNEKMDELKQEKKDIKRQIQLTDGIIKKICIRLIMRCLRKKSLLQTGRLRYKGWKRRLCLRKMWLFSWRRMLW